jgi:DNA polymerase-3 subunit gamma/tau
LFFGPSGTGKTTISRIAALEVGCDPQNIMEIAAAVYTGVDEMRSVLESLQYKSFGKSGVKAIIVDECHRLSKNAWDSILKATEEPSPHVFWFLCTTEIDKVPKTIQTRCTSVTLKAVSNEDLRKLVEHVAKTERYKASDGVIDLVVREAGGSPRQVLVNLAACSDVTDRKEAADLLKSAAEAEDINVLAQFLLKPGSWKTAMNIVNKLENENPESIRIRICNYMAKVARSAETPERVCQILSILSAFGTPYRDSENLGPLLMSIGQVLFDE